LSKTIDLLYFLSKGKKAMIKHASDGRVASRILLETLAI